jgi:hypothetical protein
MPDASMYQRTTGRRRSTPQHLLGLRRLALLEILVFLTVALAIDTYIGAGDRFAGVAPHPFWIIVLLVAVQYGAKEATVAALLASAALLTNNLPEQGFSEDLYAWLLRATKDPLMWIFAAVTIGEIRDGHRRERDDLRDDLREAREQADGIGKAYDRLAVLKDHLEARVAGEVQTLHSIFVATRGIERQDTGQVLAGLEQLVSALMRPRSFSLFLLNGGVLEAAMSRGWKPGNGFVCAFDASSPLFQAVVLHRRHLVASRPTQALVLSDEGLIAGPLTCSETGEIIGMLKIEDIDFLDLNPASIQTFQVLCDWIGSAYSNARHWEATQAARYLDPVRGVLPAALFEIQLGITGSTARRLGFDLSMMFIGFDLPDSAGPSYQAAATRAASRAAEALLRPAERCFDWRRDGWDMAILLPGRGQADADQLARRLKDGIGKEMASVGLKGAVRYQTVPLNAVPDFAVQQVLAK